VGPLPVADSGRGGGRPFDLTNFCINVKSNPRMHQNPPVSGKNSIVFHTAPSPDPIPSTVRPHYKILNPPLVPTGGGPEPWHPADPLNPSLKLLQRRADECLDGSYLGEFYAYLQ